MRLSRRDLLRCTLRFSAGAIVPIPILTGDLPEAPLFQEVSASSSGIQWVHENAMSEFRYLPETLGPGCAFLDFDNDGWMDIYFVNSGRCDFWSPTKPTRNALYKNNRDGTFTDVTEKAGVAGGTFGMGVAVGDYDNDGWPDIFVTSYGKCILYKNNRNGTFADVTEKAGLATPGWTTSAVWFDYDNDGRLDLFVCSFVDYGAKQKLACGDNQIGNHYYCIPRVFRGTASYLYHNNGDGTFTEVSKGTGIARSFGKSLGVVATDVNNDGRMDLFVANDTVQNLSDGELTIELEDGADGQDEAFALQVRRADGPTPIGVNYLSGSQKFRVAVAVALATGRFAAGQARPLESVIIDEGFGSLDTQGRAEMLDEIRKMSEFYERVIVVSHMESFHDQSLFPARFELSKEGTRTVVTMVG